MWASCLNTQLCSLALLPAFKRIYRDKHFVSLPVISIFPLFFSQAFDIVVLIVCRGSVNCR